MKKIFQILAALSLLVSMPLAFVGCTENGTDDPEPTVLKLTVSTSEVGATSATISVKASEDDIAYYFGVAKADEAEDIEAYFKGWVGSADAVKGDQTKKFTGLESETEYVAFAASWSNNVITSAVASVKFTTLEEGEEPVPDTDLHVEIVSIDEEYLYYNLDTNGFDGPVFIFAIEPWQIDPTDPDHEAESAGEYVSTFAGYFEDMEEFFLEMCVYGDQEEAALEIGGYPSGTEMVLIAAGVDEDNITTLLTSAVEIEFTIPERDVPVPTEYPVVEVVDVKGKTAYVNVDTNGYEDYYTMWFAPKSDFGPGKYAADPAEYVFKKVDLYKSSVDMFLQYFCFQGDLENYEESGLLENTEYYVIVAGVDSTTLDIITEVSYDEFVTQEGGNTPVYRFDIAFSDEQPWSVGVKVTPDDNSLYYYYSYIQADDLDEMVEMFDITLRDYIQMEIDALGDGMGNNIASFLNQGVTVAELTTYPSTEYIFYVVYVDPETREMTSGFETRYFYSADEGDTELVDGIEITIHDVGIVDLGWDIQGWIDHSVTMKNGFDGYYDLVFIDAAKLDLTLGVEEAIAHYIDTEDLGYYKNHPEDIPDFFNEDWGYAKKGNINNERKTWLQLDTDYYVAAVGVNEKLDFITKIAYEKAHTPALEIGGGTDVEGPHAVVLDWGSSWVEYSVVFQNGFSGPYTFGVIKPGGLDLDLSIEEGIEQYIDEMTRIWIDNGWGDDFIDECCTSEEQYQVKKEWLDDGEDYIFYAVGIDPQTLARTTKVSYEEFTTFPEEEEEVGDWAVEFIQGSYDGFEYSFEIYINQPGVRFRYFIDRTEFFPAFTDDLDAFVAACQAEELEGSTVTEWTSCDGSIWVNSAWFGTKPYTLFVYGYDDATGKCTGAYRMLEFTWNTPEGFGGDDDDPSELPNTSLTGDINIEFETWGVQTRTCTELEESGMVYDVWRIVIEEPYEPNFDDSANGFQLEIVKDGDSFVGTHQIMSPYFGFPGNAVAGYTDYDDNSVKYGTWWYDLGHKANRAAAVEGTVTITEVSELYYNLTANLKDENGNAINITYNGYIFAAD